MVFGLLCAAGTHLHQEHMVHETITHLALRHELGEMIRKNRAVQGGLAIQGRRMDPGYNSRGYCWIGGTDLAVEAVFDTGATRGNIDKAFLQSLMMDPATEDCVLAINDIEETQCVGMSSHYTQI